MIAVAASGRGSGHRFGRARRLKRRRLIRPLFERGLADVGSVRAGPVTVRFRLAPVEEVGLRVPFQVGFAVGRRAGDHPARNRIKRQMREVVRHHQDVLAAVMSGRPDVLTLMILYRGGPGEAGDAIRTALPRALASVSEQVAGSRPDATTDQTSEPA